MTTRPGPARRKRLSRVLRSCAVIAACASTFVFAEKTASAQGWMKERRFSEDPGIRTGDFELHPGIGGEIGYDSNWFLRSHQGGPNVVNPENGIPNQSQPVRDAAILRITPPF